MKMQQGQFSPNLLSPLQIHLSGFFNTIFIQFYNFIYFRIAHFILLYKCEA